MTYSHTKFILRKGDEYFYSRSSHRYRPLETVFPYDLEVYPIPAEDLWPAFPNNLTAAPHPLPAHCYVKRPSLIHYAEDHVFRPRDLLLEEAQICEVLLEHPHPNVAQYLGCVVQSAPTKLQVYAL